ncbi:hypothetical protein QYF36_015882 [Acer negundo]|nr:hypothetical protein QYF36_015882 [Acer negundo]
MQREDIGGGFSKEDYLNLQSYAEVARGPRMDHKEVAEAKKKNHFPKFSPESLCIGKKKIQNLKKARVVVSLPTSKSTSSEESLLKMLKGECSSRIKPDGLLNRGLNPVGLLNRGLNPVGPAVEPLGLSFGSSDNKDISPIAKESLATVAQKQIIGIYENLSLDQANED